MIYVILAAAVLIAIIYLIGKAANNTDLNKCSKEYTIMYFIIQFFVSAGAFIVLELVPWNRIFNTKLYANGTILSLGLYCMISFICMYIGKKINGKWVRSWVAASISISALPIMIILVGLIYMVFGGPFFT